MRFAVLCLFVLLPTAAYAVPQWNPQEPPPVPAPLLPTAEEVLVVDEHWKECERGIVDQIEHFEYLGITPDFSFELEYEQVPLTRANFIEIITDDCTYRAVRKDGRLKRFFIGESDHAEPEPHRIE